MRDSAATGMRHVIQYVPDKRPNGALQLHLLWNYLNTI